MNKLSFAALGLGLVTVSAGADTCVLHDRSVTHNPVTIQERSAIRRDIVPDRGGQRRCVVNFRVRINNAWHTAHGEYTWDGDRPDNEACAVAADRAETDVRQRVGRTSVVSERIMVCNDRDDTREYRQANIGTMGNASQFRPHPNYPRRFYHNGAQCRWFMDAQFTGRDIRNYQGIVCEVNPDLWVVVDKF